MFYFVCPKCGKNQVLGRYFFKFINTEIKTLIRKEKIKKNNIRWVIDFKDSCPLCRPTGQHRGTIKKESLKIK